MSGLAPAAAVLTGFVALAVYATWPLARFAASRVPMNLADPMENVWIFSWGAHALAHDPLGIFHANMFFPERYTLAYAENMLGLSLPLAPLYWLTGNGVLLTNVATLAVYVTAAFGTYLLARELGATRPVAFLAGAAFAFAPYRIGQLAHPHILGAHLVPFVLLVLVRLGRPAASSWRRVVALALLIAAQFWASVFGGLISACTVAAWGVWMVLARRRAALPALGRAAVGVAAGLVLVAPVAFAYLEARRLHPEYAHPIVEHYAGSATPGSYLDPVYGGGDLVDGSYRWLDRRFGRRHLAEKELFPGWWLTTGVAACAAGAGCSLLRRVTRRERRAGLPWAASAGLVALLGLGGFGLSLGPRWGGRPDGFPLPYVLVTHLVPGGLMRVPARFGTIVFLALALALALGLSRLRPPWRRLAVAGLGAAMVVELAPWAPTFRPPAITAAHRAVADLPGAVLALPTIELRPDGALVGIVEREPLQLYLSTAHFRPLVNGYGAFVPTRYREIVEAVQDFPTPPSLRTLAALDVRTVVVDTRLTEGSRWTDAAPRLDAWPGVRLVAADGGVRAYDISGAR